MSRIGVRSKSFFLLVSEHRCSSTPPYHHPICFYYAPLSSELNSLSLTGQFPWLCICYLRTVAELLWLGGFFSAIKLAFCVPGGRTDPQSSWKAHWWEVMSNSEPRSQDEQHSVANKDFEARLNVLGLTAEGQMKSSVYQVIKATVGQHSWDCLLKWYFFCSFLLLLMENTGKRNHKCTVTHKDNENVCREDKISIRWVGGLWFKLGDSEWRSTPPRAEPEWWLSGVRLMSRRKWRVIQSPGCWHSVSGNHITQDSALVGPFFFFFFFLLWTIGAGVSHYIDILLCLFSPKLKKKTLTLFTDG